MPPLMVNIDFLWNWFWDSSHKCDILIQNETTWILSWTSIGQIKIDIPQNITSVIFKEKPQHGYTSEGKTE